MRELGERLEEWCEAGTPFATATVVGIRGSAPRPPGATMAVSAEGEVLGSVSGGCVEGAVYELASSLLPAASAELATYGISDDDAFSVGLTCGGIIDVLVSPVSADDAGLLAEVVRSEKAGDPVALAVVATGENRGARLAIWPDRVRGSLGPGSLDAAVTEDARGMLAQGQDGTRHYGPEGQRRLDDVEVFVQSFAPPPRMIIFGAVDFTAALAKVGKVLGYRVTVCDARPVFATRARFPMADEVVVAWPDKHLAEVGGSLGGRDVVCVLTHDPKFDVPAIVSALATDVGYLGAMGSRRTTDERNQRLRAAGVTDEGLARVMGPIGLDIGARTPEETAVAICAEIIARRTGREAPSLRDRPGPIHRDHAAALTD